MSRLLVCTIRLVKPALSWFVLYCFFSGLVFSKDLNIFIIGQSISANCNEYRYGAVDQVFQIDRLGAIKPAVDPFDWADCSSGSLWIPLGKKIISTGLADKVVFMPIGVAATSVEDWMEGGASFKKLNDALNLVREKKVKFDIGFWYQGTSNIHTDHNIYFRNVISVLNRIKVEADIEKWLVAQHSACYGIYDSNIEFAQKRLGELHTEGFFVGANSNYLSDEYRRDKCHLNKMGQEMVADLWLEALKNFYAH